MFGNTEKIKNKILIGEFKIYLQGWGYSGIKTKLLFR